MAIVLDIQPYCQECLNFDPVVIQTPEKMYSNSFDDPFNQRCVIMGDTVVGCERRKYCENIKRYLEKQEANSKTN